MKERKERLAEGGMAQQGIKGGKLEKKNRYEKERRKRVKMELKNNGRMRKEKSESKKNRRNQ